MNIISGGRMFNKINWEQKEEKGRGKKDGGVTSLPPCEVIQPVTGFLLLGDLKKFV